MGTPETVTKLKRNDLVEFFNTHYIAGNTVIAIAGNIDQKMVKEKVSRAFNNVRVGPRPEKPFVRENQSEPGVLIEQRGIDQSHVRLGVRTYDRYDKRRFAIDLLATILGNGRSSRLNQEIRQKRGLAYQINTNYLARTDTGSLSIYAGVAKDKVLETIDIITEVISKIKDSGIIEQELQRSKSYWKGRLFLSLENSRNIALGYGSSILHNDPVITPEQELEKINAVTLEDIKSVANEIFSPARLNLVLVGPAGGYGIFRHRVLA